MFCWLWQSTCEKQVNVRACWHTWFISLWPWVVNHRHVSPCLEYTLSFIYFSVQLLQLLFGCLSADSAIGSALWFMLVKMAAVASRWQLCRCAVKGQDSYCTWRYSCDKLEKPGSQYLSILAGSLWDWRRRVATAAPRPTFLPIFLFLPLLETGLFHSLLDLIYTVLWSIEKHRFMTLHVLWLGEEAARALKGANQIKVLQTE